MAKVFTDPNKINKNALTSAGIPGEDRLVIYAPTPDEAAQLMSRFNGVSRVKRVDPSLDGPRLVVQKVTNNPSDDPPVEGEGSFRRFAERIGVNPEGASQFRPLRGEVASRNQALFGPGGSEAGPSGPGTISSAQAEAELPGMIARGEVFPGRPAPRTSAVRSNITPSIQSPVAQGRQVTIQSGETLSGIASREGITLGELKRLNPHLFTPERRGGDLVFPGDTVKVSTTGSSSPSSPGEQPDAESIKAEILKQEAKIKSAQAKLDLFIKAQEAGLDLDFEGTIEEVQAFLDESKVKDEPPISEGVSQGASDRNITESNIDVIPEEVLFRDSESYKSLTDEEKEFVDMAFKLIEVGGEQDARIFSEAIKQAKEVADPFFRAQVSLFQAEISGKIAEANLDFDSASEAILRAQREIEEDISSQKEFLSLEQQAELSRINKELGQDLTSLRDRAAAKGLTVSTISSESQARARESAQDVVESANRRTKFRVRELELKASRGDVAAQQQLKELRSKKSLSINALGRRSEEVLGSAGVPSSLTKEGFTPVGGVVGTLATEKSRAILSDVEAFAGLSRGFL